MTNKLKFYWLMGFLLFAAIANAQPKPDTAVASPDSVQITLSLAQYQEWMQRLNSAAQLTREAKKPSEIATATVFILQTYEGIQEKAKPVYKTGGKK